MTTNRVNLEQLSVKGKGQAVIKDQMLNFETTYSAFSVDTNLVGNCYKRHALMLPGRYKIPFSVNLELKLDYAPLILLVGEGHVMFFTDDNHKMEDIVKPEGKPNLDGGKFRSQLPFNKFAKLTVTYDFKAMQIQVNGEERFYTEKLPYMKSKNLSTLNEVGFEIGVVVNKLSKLTIKEITISEYSDEIVIKREEQPEEKQSEEKHSDEKQSEEKCENEDETLKKNSFEAVISTLPDSFQNEVMEMDQYLKNLEPMIFKRSIDKDGKKISYICADFGISYLIKVNEGRLRQSFSWYIVTAGKAETWHRNADYMEEALMETAKTNPLLADRIFYALNDCVGCYGDRCIVKTLYEFNGKKRLSCHGCVVLRMCHEDFKDVRDFFNHVNELMKRKMEQNTIQNEPIYLIKR